MKFKVLLPWPLFLDSILSIYAQNDFTTLESVVAGLYEKAQRCGVPGARPAGLRGHLEPRVTRPRPRNDIRNKPLTGYRNKYISQNFMIRGIFTEMKEIV